MLYCVRILQQICDQIDQMLERGTNDDNRNKNYDFMKKHYDSHQNNPEFLWRFARVCHINALMTSEQSQRKTFCFQGWLIL